MPGDDTTPVHHDHEHPEAPHVPIGLGSIADAFIDPATEPERRTHAMTATDYALVLASVLIAACGQLLLRYGMTRIGVAHPDAHGGQLLVQAARSLWVIGGLAVFGLSSLLWMITLSKVPLSRAYPFTAVGFLGILAATSIIPPREHVGPQLWLGAVVVVAGLLIVVQA
ncbi:MAG: hypothetical protein QOG49_816 [Frankiaceae bacterium]|jgi:drug/metabolite transporter (DMT)-like permease|nr:hypothetical protein [Frankiaceae bacterium]